MFKKIIEKNKFSRVNINKITKIEISKDGQQKYNYEITFDNRSVINYYFISFELMNDFDLLLFNKDIENIILE